MIKVQKNPLFLIYFQLYFYCLSFSKINLGIRFIIYFLYKIFSFPFIISYYLILQGNIYKIKNNIIDTKINKIERKFMKITKNTLIILCLFVLGTLISACDSGSETRTPSNLFFPISTTHTKYQLELSQTEFTINIGETDNITVTLNDKDITQTAIYIVDQESIATVEKGLITGISAGITTVTVHSENAEADKTFTVKVIDPTLPTLELSETTYNLFIGDETRIKVTLNGEDVTEQATYTSNDKLIATAEKGIIKAKYSEGSANITVSLEGANSVTFTVNITDDSEEVPLDPVRFDILHNLGLLSRTYEERNNIIEANIPAIFYDENNKKYKIISITGVFSDCTSLKSITIPESIISIADGAFSNCTSLKSVIIPDSVISLGSGAFRQCIILNNVKIGESVNSIKAYTFCDCSSLTEITIPESVESIGENSFYDCRSLKKVNIPNSVISIDNGAFNGCISLNSINIPKNITTIGNYVFRYCAFTTITIPDKVTSIGGWAFSDCPNLTKIEIPNKVTSIGQRAFNACTSLTSVSIGYGVRTIEEGAFSEAGYNNETSNLTLTIPSNVTTIGENALWLVNFEYDGNAEDTGNNNWGGNKI